MLVLRLVAANCALVAAWIGTLAVLGFRAIPMQLALLALGLATSSILVSKAILERERQRVRLATTPPDGLAPAEA